MNKLDAASLPPISDTGVNPLPWTVLAETTLDRQFKPTFAKYLHELDGICASHTSATTIGQSPVSLYVYLPDVDTVVKRAAAEGGKILKPVENQFYGDRSGFLQDPFGHLWGVATHVEDVSPKELEERMKKVVQAA